MMGIVPLHARWWPAVADQLFRQLIYVLNYGKKEAHEVENVVAMLDWISEDDELRNCYSGEEKGRLLTSLDVYLAKFPAPTLKPSEDSVAAMAGQAKMWREKWNN
jgi:hypothetical protein